MLIKYLPRESALVTALNEGQPVWSSVEHLLADLWQVLVRANSDPDKTPESLDHPVRAAMTAKAVAATKKALKALFVKRKAEYGA